MASDHFLWRDPWALEKAGEDFRTVSINYRRDAGDARYAYGVYLHGKPGDALGSGYGSTPDEAIIAARKDFRLGNS